MVLVLGGLEVPQSPCPDLAALQSWMLGQTACRQGCWQGREHAVVLLCLHVLWAGSHPSQLRALAAPSCQRPDLSEDWTATALDGTCLFVTRLVALPSPPWWPPAGSHAACPGRAGGPGCWGVGASPIAGGRMGLGHGDTYVGTGPCHESLQGRDAGPQALGGTSL